MKRWMLVTIACMALLSLAAAKDSTNVPKGASAQAATAAGKDTDYVIGAEDVLHVNVWKEPDMTVTVPVRPDGKISLPLINDVKAAGLTPIALQEDLTERLKKFITNPQVTVVVTAINSKRVFVVGEVMRPGAISMMPGMTALQAITTAGGLSQFANAKKIFVLRTENGVPEKLPFRYNDVIKGENLKDDVPLKAGDTIVVR